MMNYYELYRPAKEGDLNEIKRLIKKSVIESNNYFNWNNGMHGAAEGGHMNIVKLMIKKGASNWNKGMYGAAEGGHIDIIQFFIDKGADDWNWSMQGADCFGHIDIVEFFIDKLFYECIFNDILPKQSIYYTPEDYTEFHNEYYHEIVQLLKPFLVDDIVDYVLYDYLKM